MPLRPCIEPDCPNLTEATRCEECHAANQKDRKKRGLTGKRGSTYSWRQTRDRIIRRDGGSCVLCSSTRGIEVHHIDGNPDNSVDTNLVTLCSVCHGEVEREKRAHQQREERPR